MAQSFLILFRETLEVALIVGIVLGYLVRSGQGQLRWMVYLGLAAGTAASLVVALLFQRLAGGLSGRGEAIFEGVTMLVGAALLTTLILWVARKANVAGELEKRVHREMGRAGRAGLILLVFVSVLREGVESVIFLGAARMASPERNLLGALLGILTAAVLGFLFFRGTLRIRLGRFFAVMNVLLVLFAAGLVAHGIHELQEAGTLPTLIEHVWDINPAYSAESGSPPILHEDGGVGSVLEGLFGYNGDPSLIEVLGYLLYLGAAVLLWLRVGRRTADRADR